MGLEISKNSGSLKELYIVSAEGTTTGEYSNSYDRDRGFRTGISKVIGHIITQRKNFDGKPLPPLSYHGLSPREVAVFEAARTDPLSDLELED